MSATPPTRRRWFSYRLRSLFVLMTVISLGLAWVAHERAQSRYEVRLAEQLLANGGNVDFGGRFSRVDNDPQPTWWRTALSRLCGPRIRKVWLRSTDVPFADYSPFASLRCLEALDVDDSPKDLAPLAGLKNLNELDISGDRVTDISPLAGLNRLTNLSLTATAIDDVSALAGLEALQILSLSNTKITDLTPLAGLKDLVYLRLSNTPVCNISPLAGLTKLRTLVARLHSDQRSIAARCAQGFRFNRPAGNIGGSRPVAVGRIAILEIPRPQRYECQ